MREIKFRAWIIPVRKAYHKDTYVPPAPFMTEPFTFSDFDEEYFIPHGCYLNEMTIMQYTGLKDKSGVEIFEGYIIKVSRRSQPGIPPDISRVYFKWGSFFVNLPVVGATSIEGSPILVGSIDDITEVIGNIYENKELLEK